MKHAVNRDLHAYWDRLRSGRSAPERGDVDPAAIRHLLAYTFILEVSEGVPPRRRDLRFRLSGTRLNALFGRDLRGTPFDRLWTLRDTPAVEALLDGVLDDGIGSTASARGGPSGDGSLDLELLILPLLHHGRTHARILGSLAAEIVPGWMGLKASAPLDLLGFRSLDDRRSIGGPAAGGERAPDAWRGPAVPRLDGEVPGSSVAPLRAGRFRVYQGGLGRTPAETA